MPLLPRSRKFWKRWNNKKERCLRIVPFLCSQLNNCRQTDRIMEEGQKMAEPDDYCLYMASIF